MIAVTGADGIIGREVCNVLRERKRDFLSIVRQKRVITSVDSMILDIADANCLELLKKIEIGCVIHLAAAVPHSVYWPDTENSAQITRSIDRNILALCKAKSCSLIYMSTCGLYDRISPDLKSEDDVSHLKIVSPYFAAKYEGETIFRNELRSVIFRLAAPIGPGQKAAVVLSRFICLARQNLPIQIWGSGRREQNFVDVRDVAELVCDAAERPVQCTINIACKKPTTMIELANAVVDTIGSGKVVLSDKNDPRDMETARYSIEKALTEYNWIPKFTLTDSIYRIKNEIFEE